jgi:hypothetical protein
MCPGVRRGPRCRAARQRRAGNMSDRAPESGSADPFDDDAERRRRGISMRPIRPPAAPGRSWPGGGRPHVERRSRSATRSRAVGGRDPALAPLENPGVPQREPTVAQKQDGAGKEARWAHFRIRRVSLSQPQASFGAILVKPRFAAGYVAGARAHGQLSWPFARASTRMAR